MFKLVFGDSYIARFKLLRPLDVRGYTVPTGFESDGESIPWYGRWVFPRASRALYASFAHDHRMVTAKTPEERFNAHLQFRADLKAYKIPAWRRHIMWRAVCVADNQISFAKRFCYAIFK